MPRELPPRSALSRRELLFRSATGFGGLALCGLMSSCSRNQPSEQLATSPVSTGPRKKAKNVIFLFMSGGPSQIDTFDPKPRLVKEHGQEIKIDVPKIQFNGCRVVMQSPFRFSRHGQCGTEVSDIFPEVAKCVDDLCVIRSMQADHGEHGTANIFVNSGKGNAGFPSMGSWINYGLGSECEDLPGYVVLDSGRIPVGGMSCFSNGFLPAKYHGTLFHQGEYPVANLKPHEPNAAIQQAKLSVIQEMNQRTHQQWQQDSKLEAVIQNYEMAFKMQTAVPELVDTSDASPAVRKLYGLDQKETETFGSQCLLARKLVQRGVRFVQLLPPLLPDYDQWDQHEHLDRGHRANALATDRPIAGLLQDLKSLGMLDETLVIWGGEFGRTPMEHTNPGNKVCSTGRGHNPHGYTMWMAGGGVKPGMVYGSTDDYGFFAVENPVHVHDLHATILHLMGIDHEELTYLHGGREYRLTDVYGNVVHDIIA